MSKIITVIQLLNRTANGEEVPKKVQYNEKEYFYHDYSKNYYYINDNEESLFDDTIAFCANNEVEILEDNTEELEELDIIKEDSYNILSREEKVKQLKSYIENNRDKINEIIRYIKRKEKDEQ